MKKVYLLLILPLFFLIPLASQAYVTKSSEFIYIEEDEVVEGNLYFKAKSVTIEGQVLGDVIGIGSNIKIKGHVKGDVIVLSQNINISGKVDGSLRAVSNALNIDGSIGRNINFIGESFIMDQKASVSQDILLLSINSNLNGLTKGNVHGISENTLIKGEIEKNVNLKIDQIKRKEYFNTLKIEESAIIGGTLNYQGGNDAIIETENIAGEINKKEPNKSPNRIPSSTKFLYSVVAAFLTFLILNILFKKQISRLKEFSLKENYKTMGPGAIILFLTPIAILLALMTIVGIPLALIALALWLILLFFSKIIVALALGDYLFKLIKKEKLPWQLKGLTGIVLAWLLFALPYIGWLFSFIATMVGLGVFYYLIKNKKYEHKSIHF
jgi:hypothetical protein